MTGPLLAYLRERAGSRGLVHVREEALLKEFKASRAVFLGELQALKAAGEIRILAPLPYLVIKVRKWSGDTTKPADSTHSPYSYSKLLQPKQLNNSYRQGDPVGKSDLLAEILDTLGETDAASFEKAVELYSPHVIRMALHRVRRAQGIRKSRTALFRYLLPAIARELHQPR